MAGKRFSRLDAEDRAFFTRVRAATFANPFSDERTRIDLSIAGLPGSVSDEDRIQAMIRAVDGRLRRLTDGGGANIGAFAGEDRKLMEIAFLFDFFHRFIPHFDAAIPEQMAAGDKPIPAPFAGEAIDVLRRRGFSPEAARRYFALCFQIRRAFYFIDHALVGRSASMKGLRRDLWNNIFTHDIGLYDDFLWNRMEDFSTLVLGETGTGKGAAAVAIGRSGFIPFDHRKGCFTESFMRSFVALNLSQFPESLIESELFGHKKGAFTGAVEDYPGIFHRCSPHGAIFLDEIGEVSIPIQIKLLQVIQERRFRPVGGRDSRRFQGRVIAATNRPMEKLRENGRFREDFFYRLCSDIIVAPPLRRRLKEAPEELDDLLAHVVERILGKPSAVLAGMAKESIEKRLGPDYPWPGNVRELEQRVRRVLLKGSCEGDVPVTARDLLSRLAEGMDREAVDASELVAGYCALLYDRHGTYEAVARKVGLDRRTVRKHVANQQSHGKRACGEQGV